MTFEDEFTTTPPYVEVPHLLLSTARHFSKDRVTKDSDVKAGWYIRLFFQPLYRNGRMLFMSTKQMYGRPYIQNRSKSWMRASLQMKCRDLTYNKHGELYVSDHLRTYLSDAGINDRPCGPRLYRFSSRLWNEILSIQEMGDFPAWCWFMGTIPSSDSYLDFIDVVESERAEDRMWHHEMMESWNEAMLDEAEAEAEEEQPETTKEN